MDKKMADIFILDGQILFKVIDQPAIERIDGFEMAIDSGRKGRMRRYS